MEMTSSGWQDQGSREEGTVGPLERWGLGEPVTELVELTRSDPAIFAAKEDDRLP